MKLNFFDVYETIKEKLITENDKDGIKVLKQKIKENKQFSQLFIAYNHVKNKTAPYHVIKEFTEGINIPKKELKGLLEFFNIQEVKSKKIHESLENIINFQNKSLLTELDKVEKDEEDVKKYLLDINDIDDEEEMTVEEKCATSIIESNDYRRLNKLSGYIYSISNKLPDGKEKNLIQESIKKSLVEGKEDLLHSTINIFSVYNRVQKLHEATNEGGEQEFKIGIVDNFLKVSMRTEENAKNPDFIVVMASMEIPLFDKSQQERVNEAKKVRKMFITELRKSLRKNLNPAVFMVGETITDTVDNAIIVSTKKDKPLTLTTQIFLNIKPHEGQKELMLYRGEIMSVMKKVSADISVEIPQLNEKIKS